MNSMRVCLMTLQCINQPIIVSQAPKGQSNGEAVDALVALVQHEVPEFHGRGRLLRDTLRASMAG
jgi:hypothetical protein